jgi:nucleoside-diphosphate-sugar epimerase
MKVFVTGATGYIGFNVACAYRRAGHEVWGLVRSEDKTRRLVRNEIRTIIGTLQSPQTWQDTARSCSLLVHTAADYHVDTFALDRQAVDCLLALSKQSPQPKTLLYTSGTWVYGDTQGELVDETTPPRPAKLVTAQPATERLVLDAKQVRGLVMRPGCVYGRQGGLAAIWFEAVARDKVLQAIGDGSNRWATVHVDDLADAYVRAGESGLAGEVFNLTDGSHTSVSEMAGALARVAGYTGDITFVPALEAARTMGDLAECLALDQNVDAGKAARMLGWQPARRSFINDIEIYYRAWEAGQEC